MTWWSEYSAAPGFVLAKLAIRCRFVDRFVGSSVPSHVSGQRFSPRGTLLPSAGSRPARFPVFIGTMKVLRLPAHAYLLPYCFGHRSHARLLCSWSQSAPGEFGGNSSGPEPLVSRRSFPAYCTRGRVRDLTGSLAIHPMPLPCSKTPAEPTGSRLSDLVDAALGQPRPKASTGT